MPATGRFLIALALTLATQFPAASFAHPFDITSAKTAFLDEEVLYVSAGYPMNHEGFQELLKPLWDKAGFDFRIDSYAQPWRQVSIAELEKLFGSIDTQYLAINGDEAHFHEVRQAFLFGWACDGSLIPVLDIGDQQFARRLYEWGVDAFGVTSFPAQLEIRPVDKKLIPQNFYNGLSAPDGWELWVDDEKRFSYIDRNQDHEAEPQNHLVDHKSGQVRVIVEKSPFDVRC